MKLNLPDSFAVGDVTIRPTRIPIKRPKFQLSPEFAASCSPELRDSTNAWLQEFFGEEEAGIMVDQQAMFPPSQGKLLFVSEEMYRQLYEQLRL